MFQNFNIFTPLNNEAKEKQQRYTLSLRATPYLWNKNSDSSYKV